MSGRSSIVFLPQAWPVACSKGDSHSIFSGFSVCSDVSRQSEISIQCYLRTEEPKRGNDGIADDMGNDIYLGGVRFMPDFDELTGEDQWFDLAGGQGRIQLAAEFKPSSVCGSHLSRIARSIETS